MSEWLEEVYGDGEVCGAENQRLAVAAQIVEEMRAAVYKDTGFRCSAGIAHNKISVNGPFTLTLGPAYNE